MTIPLSKKTISIKLPRKQVINLMEIALQRMNLRIVEVDKKRGFFQAKKGVNWRSWGEVVQVEIYEDLYPNVNGSIVHIQSRSSFRFTTQDWGANDINVYQIEQLIMNLAEDYKAGLNKANEENEEKEEKHEYYNAKDQFKEKNERKFVDQNPYEILNVKQNSSIKEINDAYRNLIKMYHPDRVSGLGPEIQEIAEKYTKAINSAYDKIKRSFKND